MDARSAGSIAERLDYIPSLGKCGGVVHRSPVPGGVAESSRMGGEYHPLAKLETTRETVAPARQGGPLSGGGNPFIPGRNSRWQLWLRGVDFALGKHGVQALDLVGQRPNIQGPGRSAGAWRPRSSLGRSMSRPNHGRLLVWRRNYMGSGDFKANPLRAGSFIASPLWPTASRQS